MSRSSNKLPAGVTARKGMWIDRHGKEMAIVDMQTKHIEATIALLKRLAGDPDLDHPKIREFRKQLASRDRAGDYYTGATTSMEPFTLGFKGEEWVPELPALKVGEKGGISIYATRFSPPSNSDKWAAFYGYGRLAQKNREWVYFTDFLMMVSWLQDKLNKS